MGARAVEKHCVHSKNLFFPKFTKKRKIFLHII